MYRARAASGAPPSLSVRARRPIHAATPWSSRMARMPNCLHSLDRPARTAFA